MAKIFVYGSLRKGMYNYDTYLKDKCTYVEDGYVKGELYSIRGVSYPALIFGESFIKGEIYEVSKEVETALDVLEGYLPNDPKNEYDKILCDIYDEHKNITGKRISTYMFNMKKTEHKGILEDHILENDYVVYMSKRS